MNFVTMYNIIKCSFSMFQGASPVLINMLFQYICFSFPFFLYKKKFRVNINFSRAFVETFLKMYDCCSIPQVLYQCTMICDFNYLKFNMNFKLPVHSLYIYMYFSNNWHVVIELRLFYRNLKLITIFFNLMSILVVLIP